MSKTNKQTPRSKGNAKPKQTTARPGRKSQAPMQLARPVSRVCGLTDPFCSHAIGAKYPDDSPIRTLTYSFKTINSVSTDANGNVARMFFPTWTYQPLHTPALLGSGGTVTNWINTTVTTPIAAVTQYRIISAGLRLHRTCAPLTTQGMVRIRTWPTNIFATLDAVDLDTYNTSGSMDIALQDVKDVCVVLPHSSQPAQLFYNVTLDKNNLDLNGPIGFQPISFFLQGGPPSVAVLDVEIYVNYEVVFSDDSGMQRAATPAQPANMFLTAAANRVTSSIPAFFEKGLDAASAFIQRKALTSLGSFLGGPTGAAVGTLSAITLD